MIKGKTYKLTFPTKKVTIAIYEKEETFPAIGSPSIHWFSHQSGDDTLLGHFPKGFVPDNWFHIPSFLIPKLKIEFIEDGEKVAVSEKTEMVSSVSGNEVEACKDVLGAIRTRMKVSGFDLEEFKKMEKEVLELLGFFEESIN